MATETIPWDTADHLDSEAAIIAYLEAAFEDGDAELIAVALNNVARARGIKRATALSAQADIGALIRTVKALGFELTAKAA
jgi:hypothetical protein